MPLRAIEWEGMDITEIEPKQAIICLINILSLNLKN